MFFRNDLTNQGVLLFGELCIWILTFYNCFLMEFSALISCIAVALQSDDYCICLTNQC